MNLYNLKRIYLFYFSHFLKRALAPPDYVGILVTKRCNLKCKMCDIRKHPTSPEQELSLEEIKKIIDDIAGWGVKTVTLTGGEPFLRKDFFQIAEYAMERVAHTAINTNLTLIDKETAEKICKLPYHKFHLEVSLDGAMAATHDSIRGMQGSFEKSIDGIRLIRQVAKEKDTDVHIGTTCVLMEENIKEAMDLVRLAEGFNFVNVSFMPKLKSNVKLKSRDELSSMEEKSLNNLDKVIEELVEYKREKGLIINPEPSLMKYRDYFNGSLSTQRICNAGYMGPNIVEDGQTFICTYFIGNIKQNSIRKIWYGKEANRIRGMTEKCSKPCLQHYSIRFYETNPFLATYSYIKERIKRG